MPRTLISRVATYLISAVILPAALIAQIKPADEVDIARCWSARLVSAGEIGLDERRVYVASEGARVTALLYNGDRSWTSDLGGEAVSNIMAWEGSVFVATTSGGATGKSVLRVMSRETGIVGGAIPLPDAERHFLGTFNGSLIVVSANGIVHALDGKGTTKWRREIASGFVGSPAFGSAKVHIASSAKQVFTIDLVSGEIDSVRKTAHGITAVGVTAGGGMVVGDERGYVTSLAADGRANWQFRTGGKVSRIFGANGHLFAVSHDNFVYCLDVSNGNVTWKRRLDGRAAHTAAVNDGSYIFTTAIEEPAAALASAESGKPVGQIVFGEDEWVTVAPASSNSQLFIVTNGGLAAYSLSGASGCVK